MDKEMTVTDEHEATRQLRSMGVKTPIVSLTANTLQSYKDLFFEAGVDDFQAKVSEQGFYKNPLTKTDPWAIHGDCAEDRSVSNPWRLCNLQRVEELKSVIRTMPYLAPSAFCVYNQLNLQQVEELKLLM